MSVLTSWMIWREGRNNWWACWYGENGRIESMRGGFKTQRAAQEFAEGGRKKYDERVTQGTQEK